MDLRFIAPNLRQLDTAGSEVLCATLVAGEGPPLGVAGLIDYRLASKLSRLIKSGFATGALGEVLLLPGKPKLPFEKLIFFGVGRRSDFGEPSFRVTLERMLRTLEGLRARSAVVELPGRHFSGIEPERACEVLLELAGENPLHDVWTLVEPPEAQRILSQKLLHERRRSRGA